MLDLAFDVFLHRVPDPVIILLLMYSQQIKKDRITKLVVLPLYPQYSISTSGSSIRLLQSIFRLRTLYFLHFPCQSPFFFFFWGFAKKLYFSSLRSFLLNLLRQDSYLSGVPVSIIKSWYRREGYIKSMADLIERELQIFSKPEEVGLHCAYGYCVVAMLLILEVN